MQIKKPTPQTHPHLFQLTPQQQARVWGARQYPQMKQQKGDKELLKVFDQTSAVEHERRQREVMREIVETLQGKTKNKDLQQTLEEMVYETFAYHYKEGHDIDHIDQFSKKLNNRLVTKREKNAREHPQIYRLKQEIKKTRQEKGWTGPQVAEKLELSPATYSTYENKSESKLKTLEHYQRLLAKIQRIRQRKNFIVSETTGRVTNDESREKTRKSKEENKK